MPFINRHFGADTGKLGWYAGVAPAYVSFMNPVMYEHASREHKGLGSDGYAVQLQGGCTYRLSEAFSLFGEPAVGIVNMPGFYGRMNMMYLSLALGLRVSMR
jgi:hypothetical protein